MSMADRITRLERRLRDKRMPLVGDGTHPILCITLDDDVDDDVPADAPYVYSSGEREWVQQAGETLEALQERVLAEIERMIPLDRNVALAVIGSREAPKA